MRTGVVKTEAADNLSGLKIYGFQQHLSAENVKLLLIRRQRRRTRDATKGDFADNLLLTFIDNEQFLVERSDVHQPLRRCLGCCYAACQAAHYQH